MKKQSLLIIALLLPVAIHAMEQCSQELVTIEQANARECGVCQAQKTDVREISSSELFGTTCCNLSICGDCSREFKSYGMSKCPYCADYESIKKVTVDVSMLRQLCESALCRAPIAYIIKYDWVGDNYKTFDGSLRRRHRFYCCFDKPQMAINAAWRFEGSLTNYEAWKRFESSIQHRIPPRNINRAGIMGPSSFSVETYMNKQEMQALINKASALANKNNDPEEINDSTLIAAPISLQATLPSVKTTAEIEKVDVVVTHPQEMLYQAVLKNSAEEVNQAIDLGADVNFVTNGKPQIFWALKLKKLKAFETLLDNEATINEELIFEAMRCETYKEAYAMVQKCKNISQKTADTIYELIICDRGNRKEFFFEMLETSISFGSIDINERWHALIRDNKHNIFTKQFVDFFIKKRANPNYIGNVSQSQYYTPLRYAVLYGDLDAVQLLIDAGADINQKFTHGAKTYTPLAFAVAVGRSSIAESLMQQGAIFE